VDETKRYGSIVNKNYINYFLEENDDGVSDWHIANQFLTEIELRNINLAVYL